MAAAEPNPAVSLVKSYIARIERLQADKVCIEADIAEVYAEAHGNGFNKKALRDAVAARGRDKTQAVEHESLVDLYLQAAG